MSARVDLFVGLFIIAFAVAAHLVANQLPQAPRGLGAGDFPKVVFKVLMVLGALLAGTASYRLIRKEKQGAGKFAQGEMIQVLLLLACIAAYLVLIRIFGYLVLTPVFMFVMMYLFGMRQWVKMIVISIVTAVATYFLFNNLLLVLLPRFNLF